MSDFVIFLVEKLGRRLPEEIQDFFYEHPEKLEQLYGRKRMAELKKEYLAMQEQS